MPDLTALLGRHLYNKLPEELRKKNEGKIQIEGKKLWKNK